MATILVIDDDSAIRMLVTRVLSSAGHTTMEAANGKEGVELAEMHRPELVITDVLMPEKEGIETMREILDSAPETKIIVISGGGLARNLTFLEVAKALGADESLAKPFRTIELLQTVERVLRGRPGSVRV